MDARLQLPYSSQPHPMAEGSCCKPPNMSKLVLKFCTESDQYPIAFKGGRNTQLLYLHATTIFTSLSTWIIKALKCRTLAAITVVMLVYLQLPYYHWMITY